MTLKQKIIMAITLVAVVSLMIAYYVARNESMKALDAENLNKLKALRAVKATQIENYFEGLDHSLSSYSRSKDVSDLYDRLVKYHIDTDVQANGNYDVSTEEYGNIWETEGRYVTEYCKDFGYYDIFLICAAHGHVMYTASRESDLGENLAYGKLRGSGLAELRKKVIRSEETEMVDFRPYAPSGGEVAAFIGTPIKKGGNTIGVLAFQLSTEAINNIMNERTGMGETGETYLAAKDEDGSYSFRSSMVTMGQGKYVTGYSINAPAYWEEAFDRLEVNTDIYKDSAGKEVLVSYDVLDLYGNRWGVFSKIDMAEADIPVNALSNLLLKIFLGIVLFAILFAWVYGNSLAKSIHHVIRKIDEVINKVIIGQLKTETGTDDVIVDFKEIVSGLNRLIATFVGHLDSIPTPVMIIDKNYNIQYMNKAGAELGNTTGEALSGSRCYDFFDTTDCNTPNCACKRAMGNEQMESSETDAHPGSHNLRITYNGIPIKDQQGEIVGALEVVMDQTESYQAMQLIRKQSEYQSKEVDKLVANLNKIAAGNFVIDTALAEHDKDTAEVAENFQKINGGLETTVSNLNSIAAEFNQISDAAERGELKFRADSSKFLGSYARMVDIVNEVLDLVINPVNEAISVMEQVSNKDLTSRVTGTYAGDLEEFKNFINKAVQNLEEALSHVAGGVIQVNSASDQISKGSQSLAEGANEQASSLEEVSSSLEEMASMTNQNADNAKQADNLSKESNEVSVRGNESMRKMVDAITRIKDSSDETAKIVKTIDEIAFQTNLLALNAAVEAARAGDAGKGFAVVAEEVRNLAQRSAEAAKNTAEMIEESVNNANNGVEISSEVAELLQSITESSDKVKNLVAEIAAASKEQASGIEQVNTAVAQMNQVTQQNAANSEESASASEELSSQSAELASMVATFTLSTRRAPKRRELTPGGVS